MDDDLKTPPGEAVKARTGASGGNLGDVIARAQAALAHRPKVLSESLKFCWKAASFKLMIVDPEHAAFMRLTASLGYLPYSAEDRDARQRTIQLLFKFNRRSSGRFSIGPDGAIDYDFSILREKEADLAAIMNSVAVRLMTMSDMFEALSRELVPPKQASASGNEMARKDATPLGLD